MQMAVSECSVAASTVDGHMEMDVAMRTLWGPELDMEDMFGGITGALRLVKVMQVVQVGDQCIDVPWFDASGAPNIQMHELNDRRHDCVGANYERSLAER